MPNQLRIFRADRRISQRRLAKVADIEVTRLWKIENDYAEPTPDERRVIANVLGVPERRLWTARPAALVA